MHPYVSCFLTITLVGCSAASGEQMTDQAFAAKVLAIATIGGSSADAEASLKSVGLTCFPVVARAIPGSESRSRVSELSCSRPPPPHEGCVQEVSWISQDGKIVSISLRLEQLPGSANGAACGR